MCRCLLFILCVILPPFAVLIERGCTVHLLINIFLWCLGLFPGIIHGIYVCFYDKPRK